jgi:hypothetical protein
MHNTISKRQLKDFGLLVGLGFPIIIGWIIPLFGGHSFRTWTLWVGCPLMILGLLAPNTLFYPYKVWMKIGLALGWINSRIILGIIFLFILEPISLFMKLTGYDPLRLKKGNSETYRENKKDHKIDLKKIF